MTKNKIQLTEKQLHRVIKESVNKFINETSWQTANNAAHQAEYDADASEWDNVYEGLNNALSSLKYIERQTPKMQAMIATIENSFLPYVKAKIGRVDNLQGLADDKFKETHDGMNSLDFERNLPEDDADMTPQQKEYTDYLYGRK